MASSVLEKKRKACWMCEKQADELSDITRKSMIMARVTSGKLAPDCEMEKNKS